MKVWVKAVIGLLVIGVFAALTVLEDVYQPFPAPGGHSRADAMAAAGAGRRGAFPLVSVQLRRCPGSAGENLTCAFGERWIWVVTCDAGPRPPHLPADVPWHRYIDCDVDLQQGT